METRLPDGGQKSGRGGGARPGASLLGPSPGLAQVGMPRATPSRRLLAAIIVSRGQCAGLATTQARAGVGRPGKGSCAREG